MVKEADLETLRQLEEQSDVSQPHLISHYLYVPNEQIGNGIAKELRSIGFVVEDGESADGKDWLLLARQRVIPAKETIAKLSQHFQELASKSGGEYDGWEAAVVR